MNIAFADGHVEFQLKPRAQELIQQLQDNGDNTAPGEHGL